MLYLRPGEQISAQAIARRFDRRAEVESGYMDGQLVFRVTVWGGEIGYIAPPIAGSGIWGINLFQGAHEERGYYRPILMQMNSPFGVVTEPDGVSAETIIEDELVWDLEFFAPL